MAAYGTWSPSTGYNPLGSPSTPPGIAPGLYYPGATAPTYPAFTHPATTRTPIYQEPIHPATVGATPARNYSWYRNQIHLGTGETLGYQPGRGYYAKPGVAARPPAPVTPQPSWMDLYKQVMGTIETPAEAEARVNREIDAQMAAQQKLLLATNASERADALAAMQAQSQAGAAAAAMSQGLIASVGGEYNSAAQEISGLAGGLTGAFNKTTSGEIKAANAALGNLGAPGVQVGGVGGIGGSVQAGVENYRGGTIPSQLFTETGDAATFGLAGQTAAQNLRATQEATAAYQSTVHEINTNEQKAALALAAQRPELAHQYLQDANDARIKAITLASGLLSAGQATSATAKPTTRLVGGNLWQLNPTTGQWKRVVQGNAAAIAAARIRAAREREAVRAKAARDREAVRAKAVAAKAALPNPGLSRIYHHVVDSGGNPILRDGKMIPVVGPATARKPDIQLSRALGRWVDAAGPIPSLNKPGVPKPPPFFQPAAPGKKGGPPKPTAYVIKSGWQDIRDHQLLVRAQQKLAAYNAKQEAAKKERSKGVPWKDDPITLDEISQAPPNVLAAMGLTDAEVSAAGDPHTLQEIYIGLIHSGIPARRAWLMVRRYYPQFGGGPKPYFP